MSAAAILASPPISGSIDEVHFESIGNCIWVRFSTNNAGEWCGVFGHGPGPTADTAVINRNGECFVIAHGQGYLIDINTRRLLHKTENRVLSTVVSIPEKNVFLAFDWTNLFAYSATGLVWKSKRISVDGIKITKINLSKVFGQVYDLQGWVDFELDTDTWNYRSEFECKF